MRRQYKRILCVLLTFILLTVVVEPVGATTISDLQKDIKEQKDKLKDVNDKIGDYEDEQAEVEEEIETLDAEIVALLTDISLIEEAITSKEQEIAETQIAYDAAVEEKDSQYEAMKLRCRYMYEKGDSTYLEIFFSSYNMGDMMNKLNYIEELYEYDRKLLTQYEETVQQVADLQARLEEEKSELETSQMELEEEQAYAEQVLAQKKEEYENYAVMLVKAKQEAAAYTAKIKQETAQIKKLEEEERKRKEAERKRKEEEERKRKEAEAKAKQESGQTADASDDTNNTSDSGGSSGGSSAPSIPGSGKGKEVAEYACRFIGNPYVPGGTSLTNGADCSGFVMSVYKNFGVSLPRSSYSQANAGRAVSYSEAQPGDVIYYGGHVGIYIGNGQIVHASTQRTGIKISPATYRSIITVRRIL